MCKPLDKQNAVIRDLGAKFLQYASSSCYETGDASNLIGKWSLHPRHEQMLGREGKLSKKVVLEPDYAVSSNRELSDKMSRLNNQLFRTVYKLVQENMSLFLKKVDVNKFDVSDDFLDLSEDARAATLANALTYDMRTNAFAIKGRKVVLSQDACYGTLEFFDTHWRLGIGVGVKKEQMPEKERNASPRVYIKRLLKRIFKEDTKELFASALFKSEHKKFLNTLTDLEQQVSQEILETAGTLYLSALPEDILTASINSSNWSSCFGLGGCNWATPFHLLPNGQALIAYFVADHGTQKHCVNNVEFDNKNWRVWVYTFEENVYISTSGYPFKSKLLSNIITDWVLELLGEDYRAVIDDEDRSYVSGLYTDGVKCIATIHQKTPPYGFSGELFGVECYSCGHRDTYYGIDGVDSFLCSGCCEDSCHYCECCEERVSEVFETYENSYVCDCCLSEYYRSAITPEGQFNVREEDLINLPCDWGYEYFHREHMLDGGYDVCCTIRYMDCDDEEASVSFSIPSCSKEAVYLHTPIYLEELCGIYDYYDEEVTLDKL